MMQDYTAVIRARADGREQSLWLKEKDRDAALFEAGRLVAAYYSGQWELVKLEEGCGW